MPLYLSVILLVVGILLWLFASGAWVTVGIVLAVLGAVFLLVTLLASRSRT